MNPIPKALIYELESKGFNHVGGRLFRKNNNYYLLYDELDSTGRVMWSIRESWMATRSEQPMAAE
jgi:hypothetical protein